MEEVNLVSKVFWTSDLDDTCCVVGVDRADRIAVLKDLCELAERCGMVHRNEPRSRRSCPRWHRIKDAFDHAAACSTHPCKRPGTCSPR